MTLIELITEQSARLKKAGVSFGHGTGNAFDEAAWLVLWSLDMPLDALEEHAHDALDETSIAKAEALITRRIESRVPAAYLTREAWLQNVPFYIDERSIVPRSLIAELLADGENTGILDAWLSDRTEAVLDLCTGNGSLAVIAAMAYPEIVVDAADISTDALAIARINVDRHRPRRPHHAARVGPLGASAADRTTWCCAIRRTSTRAAWPRFRPNTAPNRSSHSPAATTAWT
jgi:ribosomal protein L3 glutamine methyltransferase